jgi:pimeloyl-ACP methyl ester carboxylesterase
MAIYPVALSIPKDINATLADVRHRVFSQEFLDQPDMDGEFPTNADRFAAQELRKRSDTEAFTQKGFMLQAIAAGWHHKSAGQLKQIGDSVGRERIQVLHGTVDRMITFPHGEVLVEELGGESGGVRWVIFEGKGHVLHMEAKERFGQVIAELVAKTEAL